MTTAEAAKNLTGAQLAKGIMQILTKAPGTENLSDAFVEALLLEGMARGFQREADRLSA